MSAATVPVQQATIRQYAKRLQLVTIGGQFATVAEQAIKEKRSHLNYLEVLLGMEVEERERNTVTRRIKDAHFPKVKTLEEFAFRDAPHIPAAVVRNLAEGGYIHNSGCCRCWRKAHLPERFQQVTIIFSQGILTI